MKLNKYFYLQEFVPKHIYLKYEEKSLRFIDPSIIKLAFLFREIYGPTTINNWLWEGQNNDSGYRDSLSPFYSPTSQHSFGRALDLHFLDYHSPEDYDSIREDIKKHQNKWMQIGLTRVENQVHWLHIDRAYTGINEINFFNP